ncbi:histidine kinase [Corallococcus macrosporus DSM 14697]|uniref:histidine kinase n=2 Tax=Corallococcus macrosporus TaxID=35 RepID=A0A250K536_9BACT|nr:histidine kinase [Corallococcus macrosporus DSM 14697]
MVRTMPPPDAATPGSTHRQPATEPPVGHSLAQDHTVQFYEDEAFVIDIVEAFITGGLERGDPLIIIAQASHREQLVARLMTAGVDTAAAISRGQLTLLDARETLARFMVGGRPDWERFRQIVGAVIEHTLAAARPGTKVRAYGEMVDVLCLDGMPDVAVELESLWNDLSVLYPLSLLCTYAIGHFGQAERARPFMDVCKAHAHVIPTERYTRLTAPEEKLREVSLLQQRAQALEAEVQQRQQAERDLRDALHQRDEFLALASHELKTPLTALQLQLQSLPSAAARKDGGERLLERLDKAIRQTERLATHIDGLLDVSRLGDGQVPLMLEAHDLSRLVRDTVARAMTSAAEADCPIQLRADLPVEGVWDPLRIQQVVGNLLVNAFKYGRGRPVEVRVEGAPDHARITVRDHGIGIAAEHQERIFHRFERAVPSSAFGGLGLGLYAARQVVVAHGGILRVESEPGHGAAFIVELPYRPQ